MDKVVEHMFVFEGQGQIRNFPGNYTIYRDTQAEEELKLKQIEKPVKVKKEKPKQTTKTKMSFNEKREFEQLEKDMESLNEEKDEIEAAMSSGTLSNEDLMTKSARIQEVMDLIDEKEMRWLELSEIGN